MHPWRRYRFHEFGDGSILHKPAWVAGPEQIAIGRNVLVLHDAWFAVEAPARSLPSPVIRVGDGVAIRPHCTISAAAGVEIEDDVVIAAFTTIIDSDHTWDAGLPNVLYNPLRAAPVRIGRGTWIGERVAVLRGADVGRFCLIGANSVVRGKIPDYSIAVGAPARVVGTTNGPGSPG
jgi:acetyltransferase-like isoleucine patch superfamily enzyme